ncbi:unnamed protein product [Pleuronectes platessa]|uniref:Uncharacterized protein n=1 Tax=Pleuronectes platessa TaxID=8262 RepID=A0A9N7W0S7_PLEPL|nr:unnamed protein product [Pleuronectes platessa]
MDYNSQAGGGTFTSRRRSLVSPQQQQQQLVQPRRRLCYRGATGEEAAERELSGKKCQQFGGDGSTRRSAPGLGGGSGAGNLSAASKFAFKTDVGLRQRVWGDIPVEAVSGTCVDRGGAKLSRFVEL